MKILVTGSAGFIGTHTALRPLRDGHDLVGVDNLSPYHDVGLKRARLAQLSHPCFGQIELDLVDAGATRRLFERERFGQVVHLAALTGFAPSAPLAEGIARFVAWYKAYYHP